VAREVDPTAAGAAFGMHAARHASIVSPLL